MAGDPSKLYRAFHDRHLTKLPEGGYRLASSWFRSVGSGVSVDDGSVSSAEESYHRHKPCGLAAVPKSIIEARGLQLELDDKDTEEERRRNPAHRIVKNVSTKDCGHITKAAEIVYRLEGWQVRGAGGSMGVDPPKVLVAANPKPTPEPPPELAKGPDGLTLQMPLNDPRKPT